MEEGAAHDAHEKNPNVVAEFVGKKSDDRRGDEHTEGQNGIHKGYVHIIDSYVLHLNIYQ